MKTIDPKFLILIYLIIAFCSCYFAKKEKRNPYLWFFLGIILGVNALIILLFLNFKDRRKKNLHVQNALTIVSKQNQLKEDSKFWYYLNKENLQIGPMSSTKLHSLFKEGTVSISTYIWNEELDDWKFLKDTELYNLFTEKKNAI